MEWDLPTLLTTWNLHGTVELANILQKLGSKKMFAFS
tara:strand:- start:171 stop:281 length:111 start_codon:yes stop_codon:yes gene_type:complete